MSTNDAAKTVVFISSQEWEAVSTGASGDRHGREARMDSGPLPAVLGLMVRHSGFCEWLF